MNNIGLDAVLLRQELKGSSGKTILRKGLLGVGIEVKDIQEFRKSYNKCMEKTLGEFNQKLLRPVYSSIDLSRIFEYEKLEDEHKVLEKFKNLILPKIEQVHFFYTYIFGLKGKVSVYGNSPDYTQIPLTSNDKTTQDFYDLISNSYPMLCAWELTSQNVEAKLFLDNFQGRVCPAWNELTGTSEITIYYKGDQCNELISTADLFVKLIKNSMIPNISCFLEKDIKKTSSMFGKKCKTYFMGKRCLNKMVPHMTRQIRCRHLAKHPIIYMVKENPQEEGEEKLIENSPLFNKIVKKTNSLDGCLKYFHPDDSKIIEKNDLLVSFGKRGDAIFGKLEKAEYEIKKF
jgi:hypothetical protein